MTGRRRGSDSPAVRRAAPSSTPSFSRASPSIDRCGIPSPSCQDSGTVASMLSVPIIIAAAPRLPTAQARGATGFAAIREPRLICATPVSRASFCAPSFSRSRAVSGLL
jgi:hypothetical protein